MCGIFGYKGQNNHCEKILLHGLEKLEYRGYDSAGLAVGNLNGEIKLIKSIGKVSFLADKVSKNIKENEIFDFGIAHTRWATHGGVTENNTHPHHDSKQNIYLVHNGIIENYMKLKRQLIKKGYIFYGETDSEVVAKLIEDNRTGNFLESVEKTLPMLEGAYALLIINKQNPGEIIGIKYGSPLIFAKNGKGEFFFSSDAQALSGYANNIIFLEDGDLVYIKDNDYVIKSEGKLVNKPLEKINIDAFTADKGDFEHFMLKEIFEQPNVIRRIFKGRIDFENKILTSSSLMELNNLDFDKIVFIGCGTSYHAGVLGTYWIQNLTNMDASVEIANELEYKNIKINPKTLYVFISQSGETADTIAVLKNIKAQGGHAFGVVNVVGSTISRLTDFGLFTRAGTEVGVASTKAFTAQITCILMLTLFFAKKHGLNKAKYEKIFNELQKIPGYIEQIFANKTHIQKIAKDICQYQSFFFLGRHYQLPIAYESSLKLKEISYIPSNAYPAGELKHGPLALIDENVPVVVFMPEDLLFEKNISSLTEVKARKGKTIVVSDKLLENDINIQIPKSIDELYPFLTIIVGQLLSYYIAKELGREIDKPRNLAKSVTVK